MQLTERDRTITMTHTPGQQWLLGGFFIVVGALALLVGLTVVGNAEPHPLWQLGATSGMGAVALGAGVWLCWRAPRSLVVLDVKAGLGRVERHGLGVRETIEFPLDGIAAVELERSQDDEGGEVFRPALRMKDGHQLVLSPVWMHHGPQELVGTLAHALARPAVRR